MALWGNNDNVTSTGTVSLDYATGTVTGAGTSFATDLEVGQVIRFGIRDGVGTYYGDAVISGITSERVLSIASTAGLSGAAIAATDFYVSELPVYTVGDSTFSENTYGVEDKIVYGISTSAVAMGHSGSVTHYGWVGVQTYIDCHGNYRVKTETLVAMGADSTGSGGISTGAGSIVYPTDV
jgi:hypothetical protein